MGLGHMGGIKMWHIPKSQNQQYYKQGNQTTVTKLKNISVKEHS